MRDRIEAWGQKTYIETFKERSREGQYSNKRAAELTQYVLRYQNLANKVMSGYSTSGLDKIEEEVGRFQYVKVFNAVRQLKDWTPLDMLYGTCYLALKDMNVKPKAMEWKMSEPELIAKMCGRAMRGLPSYIREFDLRCQLEERFPTAEFRQNELLDTVIHADLIMDYQGERYFFWSFVDTRNSIANFQDKFLGHRHGVVPDGNHVICPFSLDYCDDIDGWKLYDSTAASDIARAVKKHAMLDYGETKNLVRQIPDFFSAPRLLYKKTERVQQLDLSEEQEFEIGSR